MEGFSENKAFDSELVEEHVKQIALNRFYEFYVRKDINSLLEYVHDDLHWIGSKEHFVAHNKEEFANLMKREIALVGDDTIMKVLSSEVISLVSDCYVVQGEIELRMPVKNEAMYYTLSFTTTLVKDDEEYKIKALQTNIDAGDKGLSKPIKAGQLPQGANGSIHEDFDQITGLLTIDSFKRELKHFISGDNTTQYAMICTDVSHFEKINNLYGLKRADALLVDLAGMLTSCSINVELCCRSVADHFLVMISYDDQKELEELFDKLVKDFARKITDKYVAARPKLRIGAYLFVGGNEDVEHVIDCANVARKSLRIKKETRVAFYNKQTYQKIERIEWIESNMKEALMSGEFKVFFQPKYNIDTKEIVGAEALCRWIRKDGSMVYPDEFIPVFERNGFISELDFFMLGKVCKMIERRMSKNRFCVPVSINQSRVLLQDPRYVDRVAMIMARYNTPPSLIELELTERLFSENTNEIGNMMKKLKELGVHWSIDDFGTGYSSLNLLKDLPVDIIKIDKSFLDETETSTISRIIIRKTVELTQELDKVVVCEGVETINQAEYLRNIHCNVAQGYYYSKPMPMKDFELLLNSI